MVLSKSELFEQNKKFNEFHKDLLVVLRNDSDGVIELMAPRTFRNSKTNRLAVCRKLFVDKFVSHKPLVYESFEEGVWHRHDRSDMKDKKVVCVETDGGTGIEAEVFTLEDCFYEMMKSSGFQMEFLEQIRQSVIDKYVSRRFAVLEGRGIVKDGVIDVLSLGMEPLEPFYPERSFLVSFTRMEDGTFTATWSNSLAPRSEHELVRLSLRDVQLLGEQLYRIMIYLSSPRD